LKNKDTYDIIKKWKRGGDTMKDWIPYILPSLSFILSLVTLIINERRIRRKEKEERLKEKQAEMKNGAYPPRRDKHRK
jgi:hypothetical protein